MTILNELRQLAGLEPVHEAQQLKLIQTNVTRPSSYKDIVVDLTPRSGTDTYEQRLRTACIIYVVGLTVTCTTTDKRGKQHQLNITCSASIEAVEAYIAYDEDGPCGPRVDFQECEIYLDNIKGDPAIEAKPEDPSEEAQSHIDMIDDAIWDALNGGKFGEELEEYIIELLKERWGD